MNRPTDFVGFRERVVREKIRIYEDEILIFHPDDRDEIEEILQKLSGCSDVVELLKTSLKENDMAARGEIVYLERNKPAFPDSPPDWL
jgi:hypothetical protein